MVQLIARVLPYFPGRVVAGAGISITQVSTTYTIASNFSAFGIALGGAADAAAARNLLTLGGPGGATFGNLYLRTHPDLDLSPTTVQLVHADAIVMNDGALVTNWDNITANQLSSGAGGLDTGSPANSTWYEIYAIRKSSDGTKNLLLHRMKDFFKDQSQETDDQNVALRPATGAPGFQALAQGFQVATAGKVPYVDAKLFQAGTIAGGTIFWAEIQTDSSGSPSGVALAVSDKMPPFSVPLATDHLGVTFNGNQIRFHFRTPATLSTSTQYHLVFKADYAASDTNQLLFRFKGTTNPYANGKARSFNGSVWADIIDTNSDFWFRVFVVRNDSALVMPAGYDQFAKIGQVYRASATNLMQFAQRDRLVRQAGDQILYGSAVANSASVADQTNTVDLYAGVSNVGIPWNARKVLLGVELFYASLPAALAFAQVNIRYPQAHSDVVRPNCFANTTISMAGMGHSQLIFHEDGQQQFRWQLFSTDSATANKSVIIALDGYEWT
jgi:hypothetical protein